MGGWCIVMMALAVLLVPHAAAPDAPVAGGTVFVSAPPLGCADFESQQRAALWWLPAAAAYRDVRFGKTTITLFSPLDGSWHGDGMCPAPTCSLCFRVSICWLCVCCSYNWTEQVRIAYRVANLPAGARIRIEFDGDDMALFGAVLPGTIRGK